MANNSPLLDLGPSLECSLRRGVPPSVDVGGRSKPTLRLWPDGLVKDLFQDFLLFALI